MPVLIRLLLVSTLAASLFAQAAPPPYKRADLAVDARVRDLLARMTLEEKFWQLFMIPGDLDDPAHDYSQRRLRPADLAAARDGTAHGRAAHAERINAIQRYFVEKTRLGIPIIPFEEACTGSRARARRCSRRRSRWRRRGTRRWSTRVAAAIARETRSRGIRQVLSPVDQHRGRRALGPRGGDVRRGSVPVVGDGRARSSRAFERAGVVTTPKHFVANVGEGGRDSYPIDAQRAHARASATFRRSSRRSAARRALGDDARTTRWTARRRRRIARLLNGHPEARLGLQGLRDLRRRRRPAARPCCT